MNRWSNILQFLYFCVHDPDQRKELVSLIYFDRTNLRDLPFQSCNGAFHDILSLWIRRHDLGLKFFESTILEFREGLPLNLSVCCQVLDNLFLFLAITDDSIFRKPIFHTLKEAAQFLWFVYVKGRCILFAWLWHFARTIG